MISKELKKALLENKILLEALKEIRYKQGKVCSTFEVCHHDACQSSYAAHVIADKALRKVNGHDGNDEVCTTVWYN